jgi:hypothetical protein
LVSYFPPKQLHESIEYRSLVCGWKQTIFHLNQNNIDNPHAVTMEAAYELMNKYKHYNHHGIGDVKKYN